MEYLNMGMIQLRTVHRQIFLCVSQVVIALLRDSFQSQTTNKSELSEAGTDNVWTLHWVAYIPDVR